MDSCHNSSNSLVHKLCAWLHQTFIFSLSCFTVDRNCCTNFTNFACFFFNFLAIFNILVYFVLICHGDSAYYWNKVKWSNNGWQSHQFYTEYKDIFVLVLVDDGMRSWWALISHIFDESVTSWFECLHSVCINNHLRWYYTPIIPPNVKKLVYCTK